MQTNLLLIKLNINIHNYSFSCINLVVKESILADTFLYIARGTGEEDIVAVRPLVLDRILHFAFFAHS